MNEKANVGIRWTIGDVSDDGFEALRLSLWGARRLFGAEALYTVCVNSVPVDEARRRVGAAPAEIDWRAVTAADLPSFLRDHLDADMAEGVGWKFAPLQVFPDRFELALDNDCILWSTPEAIRRWLAGTGAKGVIAEDVRRCFGRFAHLCPDAPRNSGIRGLPPHFDLADALRAILAAAAAPLTSELDEQGLQVAATTRLLGAGIVGVDEVSICSPFPPHRSELGRCGAHFVGLNARSLPWHLDGRPASEYVRAHWRRRRRQIYERLEVPFDERP